MNDLPLKYKKKFQNYVQKLLFYLIVFKKKILNNSCLFKILIDL